MTEKMVTVVDKQILQQSITTMRTTAIDGVRILNIPKTTRLSVIYCYFEKKYYSYYLFINL